MHVVRTPNQFPIFLFPCCLCINLAINPWQNSPMYQSLIPKFTISEQKCAYFCKKKWCIVGYCLMPSGICEMGLLQTPSFQHCLHMRNLDSNLDYLLIFSCDQAAIWLVQSVCLSVCPSVRLSVRPSHLFHHVPIIVSSWNFQELLPMTKVTSMQKVKVRGQRSRSQRSWPNLTVSGL